MSERRIRLGEPKHESANIDYGIEDKVVLSEFGIEKIGRQGITGKVIEIKQQQNGRNTTTIKTELGETITYQSNFFRKAKYVRLGPIKK
jgi:uncharacterized protein Veg